MRVSTPTLQGLSDLMTATVYFAKARPATQRLRKACGARRGSAEARPRSGPRCSHRHEQQQRQIMGCAASKSSRASEPVPANGRQGPRNGGQSCSDPKANETAQSTAAESQSPNPAATALAHASESVTTTTITTTTTMVRAPSR